MDELAPLHVVAGAPGAGKTTLLPHLVDGARRADGPIVMDIDELLEDGTLLGVPIADQTAAPIWPAYDRMWQRILTMVRRVGRPTLLLRPIPDADELADNERWPGSTRWALLDCADDLRVSRLRERGWPAEEVDDAMRDAADGRALLSPVFDGSGTPHETAERILAWATGTG